MTSPIEAPRHDAQHRRPLSWMLSKFQSPPKPQTLNASRCLEGLKSISSAKNAFGFLLKCCCGIFLGCLFAFFSEKYVPTLLKKGTFLFICCLSPLKSIGWKREELWCNMTKPTLRKKINLPEISSWRRIHQEITATQVGRCDSFIFPGELGTWDEMMWFSRI